MMSNLR